jgi:hypothetical protein
VTEPVPVPYETLLPGQKAVMDQNVAAANERIDVIIERLADHMNTHICSGPWCVSPEAAEAILGLNQEQLSMLVTLMGRRLVRVF